MAMETTRTGPSIFKAMEAAVRPLAVSLKVIEKNTAALTPEAQAESNRAEKIKSDEAKEQTQLLKTIGERVGGGVKNNPIVKFFTENWGKLLAGFVLWNMKWDDAITIWQFLKEKWTTFMEMDMWEKLATIGTGVIIYELAAGTISALGTAFATSMALKWAGIWKPGGGGFIGPQQPMSATGLGRMLMMGMAIGSIVYGVGQMISDGFAGLDLAAEWKVNDWAAVVGGALAGTKSGWAGAFKKGSDWAAIGAGIGFMATMNPLGALVGGIIGLALGGILGFIGGETVSKWLDESGKKLIILWNNFDTEWAKFQSGIEEFVVSWLPEWWQKHLNEIKRIKEENQFKEDVGGDIFDAEGNLTEAGQKKFDKAETEHGRGKPSTAVKTLIRKGDVEAMKKEKWTLTSGTSLLSGQETSDVRALSDAITRIVHPKTGAKAVPVKRAAGVSMVNFGTHATEGTRASSWTGMTGDSKRKANLLSEIFSAGGGIELTSGFRDKTTNRQAMIDRSTALGGNKYGKGGYRLAYRLTEKERNAPAGSDLREQAVDKLLAMPDFGGSHVHGTGMDIRYPAGFGPDSFPALKGIIQGVFPGAQAIKEEDHVHLKFNPSVPPAVKMQQMSKAHSLANRGSAGGTNITTVIKDDSTHTTGGGTTVVGNLTYKKDDPKPKDINK